MIEVRNLVKRYGDHVAVDNLNFTVEKGEIVGFLGPNGAGKSTTMNIITGYIPATEGTVLVDGHDIMDETKLVKQSIGYLPEMPPIYPEMRVKEYLQFVADIKYIDKKKKKPMIEDIMEMTVISECGNQLIKHLSKGYKQRVGLAGALMGYPEVIILDEPTVGLDPAQIIEIRDLIKSLRKEHTILLSSHILSEVSAVCDKVMIINNGKLIVSDTPENLISHTQTSQNLSLLIKGKEEIIGKALELVEGIKEQKFEERQDGKIMLTLSAEEDITETVFYALADARCPIYEMKTSSMSLEDIFLEVTKEETEDAGNL